MQFIINIIYILKEDNTFNFWYLKIGQFCNIIIIIIIKIIRISFFLVTEAPQCKRMTTTEQKKTDNKNKKDKKE